MAKSDQVITQGKLVSLTYSILALDGEVLEQTDLPVTYIHGGQVELIGGMDRAIGGKGSGDEVEMLLGPDEGFGPWDPSLTFADDLDNVPEEFRHLGAEVPMRNDLGEVKTFHVTRIADGKLMIDGNHPLAGKPLRVHVRVQDVRDPTHAELSADLGAGHESVGRLH
ncbi:FKBP-type peptidyl-prolyl cis-trans isomerase [Thiocystis violacea]|uniref:FKBP-type peptidyl-prolyl cis-trans isomerase n=1 Tax=Thiocystis violacea TaxID=13725 RepID=UPI001906E272|nr:peptidylprolyl isomerase [Thiocystis violacea]MBK1719968.1 peptidylprolyl isomerase [Thiocystis violacea]